MPMVETMGYTEAFVNAD